MDKKNMPGINTGKRGHYFLLLLFPFSFLLHNINEMYGLIGTADIAGLLLEYTAIALCVALASGLAFKQAPKAVVFSFILLVVLFFFGVYKDFAKKHLPAFVNSYKFLLPLLLVILALVFLYLKKTNETFTRLSQAILFFLVVNMAVESGRFAYNVLTSAEIKQDFGDYHHQEIKNFKPVTAGRKPVVFWIIFDEYANSSTLKKVWGFSNPLDSMLRARGFFVARSSRSNYNFTHYSVASMLDMVYLKELKNHAVVGLTDLQRGAVSIYDNNTVRVFEKSGYAIRNYSIFDVKDHPSQGLHAFDYVPRLLINFQTLEGRIRQDISWNFSNLLKRNKPAADSLNIIKSMIDLDTAYKGVMGRCLQAVSSGAATATPTFYLFHFLLPHEPYMYNADGSIAFNHGYTGDPRYYIPHLQYTNTLISNLTDSILAAYRNKDVAIILQGDHGFRFADTDPLFSQESCRNLYAVYCTDGDYSPWYPSLSMVNSFRILFNKYFHAGFPLLPDSSYNLFYR